LPDFSNDIGTYVLAAIVFLAGLITRYTFETWRNKIPRLQYSINKSALGKSVQDDLFGKVQITYNDRPVKNLFLCDLTLVNNTNKDFEDIEITVWCDIDTVILVSRANKFETINSLSLTEEYSEERRNAKEEEDLKLAWSKRDYIIPILNRDDIVKFSCLVTSMVGAEPQIYLECDHSGLKLDANFVQPQLFWGENQGIGALVGLFVTSIISIFVVQYVQSKAFVALAVYLLAASLIFPGVLTLKILNKLRKIIR